jgi:D-2-hydroxyacid dehydrogenase (NADP+)
MSVLIVAPEAEWYVEHLRARFPGLDVHGVEEYADAAPLAAHAEILMPLRPGLTADLVARMPRLEWVQAFTSGTDHLRPALAGRDVVLTSASGIHGPQMSEMAVLHMLALNRDVVGLVESRRRHTWDEREQLSLYGKTIGIVGLGSSGRRLVSVCLAFGMRVIGISRSVAPIDGVERIFPRARLAEAAAQVDYLVLVLPADAETAGLVDAEVLRAMRPTAFVINLGRGPLIDQPALVDALATGSIAGAGLDVTDPEPLPAGSPLWDMPNVFITPHLAGRTDRYREQVVTVVEPNLRHWLAGRREELINRV